MADPIAEDGRWLLINYQCECGEAWSDEWSCACDDECSSCGAVIEASDHEDITGQVQHRVLQALKAARPARVPTGLYHALEAETATADQLEAAGDLIRAAYDRRMAEAAR